MLMVLVKNSSIYFLQDTVNSILLDKELMRCHTLLLPPPISNMVHQRTFTKKFTAILHRLDNSSLGSTYSLHLR
jgi:hypothetical protein